MLCTDLHDEISQCTWYYGIAPTIPYNNVVVDRADSGMPLVLRFTASSVPIDFVIWLMSATDLHIYACQARREVSG